MNVTHIVFHTVAKRGATELAEIDRWHRERGFSGFGYHYYVRKDGRVEKGRADTVPGAHCLDGGMNSRSLGICLEGHGDYEPWTPAQERTFYRLALELAKRHTIKVANVIGHREAGARKTCPGTLIDCEAVRNRLRAEQSIGPLPIRSIEQ